MFLESHYLKDVVNIVHEIAFFETSMFVIYLFSFIYFFMFYFLE